MRLLTFLLTSSAAAGAYVLGRRLMDDETVIAGLPEPLQGPATGLRTRLLRTRLLRARATVADGFREGRAEREAAQQELMQEYHRRTQH